MASVDLSLSGLASGFDWKSVVDQLVEVERAPQQALRREQLAIQERNNAYSSIKTELSSLQLRVKALQDAALYDSRTASVSDAAYARATVNTGAALGTFNFNITQLATAARTLGAGNVGQPLSTTSDVSGITLADAGFSTAVSAGTFTVNGKQITVDTTDTLQQVFDKIATATGDTVTGSYDPDTDKFTLTSASGPVVLGSATDTSNFLQVARLYNNGTASITSAGALGGVRTSATLASSNLTTAVSDGGSGAGEFRINGVSITFSATTDTVQSVLDRINNSAAGVTASYDALNDRFLLSSKTTGDMGFALEDVTGSFLAATGLSGGTLERGKNLLYTVNGGDQLVSQSNTISAASSGLTGISVTALKEGAVSVTVASDTAKIKSAITGFIDAFNRVQNVIETNTASSTDSKGVVTAGTLANESDADEIAKRLRSLVYSSLSGLSGVLDHLADLGIKTSGNDNKLTVEDSELLDGALQNKLGDVRQLFADETNGLGKRLTDYLDKTIGENGTLVTHQTTLTKQATDITTQMADLERMVQASKEQMTARFVAMETAQAKLNQQLNFLLKQFNQS